MKDGYSMIISKRLRVLIPEDEEEQEILYNNLCLCKVEMNDLLSVLVSHDFEAIIRYRDVDTMALVVKTKEKCYGTTHHIKTCRELDDLSPEDMLAHLLRIAIKLRDKLFGV